MRPLFLRFGLRWNTDRSLHRKFLLRMALWTVLLLSSLATYLLLDYTIPRLILSETLRESYFRVIVSAANGDARFRVGEELFECRGGSLGKS